VRPHELEIVARAGDDTWPVTLSQVLTAGPNTRIEFRRDGSDEYVDVELTREAFNGLRERLGLTPGAHVHLRPRRITRFVAGEGQSSGTVPGGVAIARSTTSRVSGAANVRTNS